MKKQRPTFRELLTPENQMLWDELWSDIFSAADEHFPDGEVRGSQLLASAYQGNRPGTVDECDWYVLHAHYVERRSFRSLALEYGEPYHRILRRRTQAVRDTMMVLFLGREVVVHRPPMMVMDDHLLDGVQFPISGIVVRCRAYNREPHAVEIDAGRPVWSSKYWRPSRFMVDITDVTMKVI